MVHRPALMTHGDEGVLRATARVALIGHAGVSHGDREALSSRMSPAVVVHGLGGVQEVTGLARCDLLGEMLINSPGCAGPGAFPSAAFQPGPWRRLRAGAAR